MSIPEPREIAATWSAGKWGSGLPRVLWVSGRLHDAAVAVLHQLRQARDEGGPLGHSREVGCLRLAGLILAASGDPWGSEAVLQKALTQSRPEEQVSAILCLAQRAMWLNKAEIALPLAIRAFGFAQAHRIEGDLIRAARLHGEAALALGDLSTAEQRLTHVLRHGRTTTLRGVPLGTHIEVLQDELAARIALAELQLQRNAVVDARETLDDIWVLVERVPLPFLYADASNVLVHIERKEGNRTAALTAAIRAYVAAWCDGAPYAYAPGLERGRLQFEALGTPPPACPPFDRRKLGPDPDPLTLLSQV